MKSCYLDMSGLAKASPGGQVLVSKADFSFLFSRNYILSIFISKSIIFSKMRLLLKAGCRVTQKYTFGFENLLFEVIS